MSQPEEPRDDQFKLYDLTVEVEKIEGHCTCNMAVGDKFYLRGGKISLPEGADFCLYALQSAIPVGRRRRPALRAAPRTTGSPARKFPLPVAHPTSGRRAAGYHPIRGREPVTKPPSRRIRAEKAPAHRPARSGTARRAPFPPRAAGEEPAMKRIAVLLCGR